MSVAGMLDTVREGSVPTGVLCEAEMVGHKVVPPESSHERDSR